MQFNWDIGDFFIDILHGENQVIIGKASVSVHCYVCRVYILFYICILAFIL